MQIENQLLECFRYDDSSSRLEKLDKEGILEKLIPTIKEMKDVGKCKYHVVDSYQHSLFTLKKFEEILCDDNFFPSHLKVQILDYLNKRDEDNVLTLYILKLGVFIHDIGKPSAKTIDSDGRAHFRGHDMTGSKIALDLARNIGLGTESTEKLFRYVRYHMVLLKYYKTNDLSRESLWEVFEILGDDIIGIMLLGYCDLVATLELLDSNKISQVIKTYMEFILTSYLYKYKIEK